MADVAPAIEVVGLSKSFKGTPAIRQVDLRVRRGEMFALVGPDGAGKTTFLRLLCGIIKADSGGVRVRGRIGYFSQGLGLYGDLSVDENIEFFAEIHGVAEYRSRREQLLELTALKPFRDRLADRLSGGMKQKLGLACTLVHGPSVLLLDEPTTGVDPLSRREFWIILSRLRAEGITMLITTPYLDEAERCARVGLMASGRLLEVAEPAVLRSSLKGSLEEVVCGQARRAYALLNGAGLAADVEIFGDRLHVLLEEPERERAAIRRLLRSQGIEIRQWRPIQPRLENVFISLLRGAAALPGEQPGRGDGR